MDNYSKMVLGFEVAEALCFDLIKGALQNTLFTINTHPDQIGSFLVADGGRENHNQNVDGFLQSLTDYKMIKIRALKDLQFSNSPIEAIHRILKGWYLRSQKFKSIEELKQCLAEAVFDYNEKRPHGYHSPKTPKEVYFATALKFDVSIRMRRARIQRMAKNKSSVCTICTNLAVCPMKTFSQRSGFQLPN
jgi:putative transposase